MGMRHWNQPVWSKTRVVAGYEKYSELQPPEETILSELQSEMTGKRILDIGVGAGRTTPHLLKLSKDYIGIDYSPQMVERCQTQYPSTAFDVCDARDLSRFRSGSFDLVIFSFNGIDYVDHGSRLKILNEVRRVLAERGAFVFSSHNRDTSIRRPWDLSHLSSVNPFMKPLRFAKRSVLYTLGIVNGIRNIKKESSCEDYAIINDEAHEYTLLTYYISIRSQIKQLKDIGFGKIDVFGLDGKTVDWERTTNRDPWIYYLCRV